MGSLTSPPCEEHVVWFVHSNVLPIGMTAHDFIRDALNPMDADASIRYPNWDGSNRLI